MTRRLNRLLPPLLAFACGAAVMLLFLRPAHAEPVIAVTPTGLELSWQAWLAVALASAGGALKILDVLLAGLRQLAPMTKTTIDDRARDKLQVVDDTAHRKLDAILQVIGGLVPAAGVPTGATDKPAAPVLVNAPGSGTAAMLIVLLLGVAAAPTMSGCAATASTVKADVATIEGCSAADAAAIVTASARIVADIKAPDHLAAALDVIAQLAAINGAWGRCKGALPPAVPPAPIPA